MGGPAANPIATLESISIDPDPVISKPKLLKFSGTYGAKSDLVTFDKSSFGFSDFQEELHFST